MFELIFIQVPENVLEFEEEQRKLEQEEHLTKDTLENLPNEESLKTDYCIKPDKNLSTDSGIAMMPESETKSSSKISESLMSFLNETGNDSDNDNEDKVENITNEDDLNSQQPQAVTSDDDEICKEMNLDTDDSVLNQDLDITEESLDSIDPPMKTDHDQYHEEEKSPTENEIDKDNGEKEVNHYDKINDVKSFLNISDISSIANLREMNYDAYDAHGADDDDVGSCKFSEDESDDDQKSSVQDELEKLDLSDDGKFSI